MRLRPLHALPCGGDRAVQGGAPPAARAVVVVTAVAAAAAVAVIATAASTMVLLLLLLALVPHVGAMDRRAAAVATLWGATPTAVGPPPGAAISLTSSAG